MTAPSVTATTPAGALPHAAGGAGHGLAHLPLPLFAAPMGIGGLGLAWREAGRTVGAPALVGETLLAIAAAVWILVAVLHVLRIARHPEQVAADLRHPIRSAFAGAVTIGLMILSAGLIPYAPAAAAGLWLFAVAAHLAIGAWVVNGLLTRPREAATLTPPLLIPLVGNILAPVFGAKLGYETLSWMLFGVGTGLWIIVQPLILGRIVTGPAMPDRLKPTLVILLAPPAVGSLALAALTQGFGPAPLAVFGFAAFTALALATLIPTFRRIPFAMSWWGWTFPSAAFAVALLAFAHAHPAPVVTGLAWLVLALASAIVTLVSACTVRAARNGHLLAPEP